MREILFRGKRRDNDEWVYGSLQVFKGYSIFDKYVWKNFFTVNHQTVGQYTGLLDKNGKKIFEGDIISVTGLTPNPTWDYTSVTGVVRWTGGAFEVEGVENDDYTPYGWLHDSCAICREVIGNVYDNPELLGVE